MSGVKAQTLHCIKNEYKKCRRNAGLMIFLSDFKKRIRVGANDYSPLQKDLSFPHSRESDVLLFCSQALSAERMSDNR